MAESQKQGGRRRRDPSGRPHKITVRLSDAELAIVEAGARRTGRSRASWLAAVALEHVAPSVDRAAERADIPPRAVAELADDVRLAADHLDRANATLEALTPLAVDPAKDREREPGAERPPADMSRAGDG